MPKSKYFSLSKRIAMEHMIRDAFLFKAIARELGRDCSLFLMKLKPPYICKGCDNLKNCILQNPNSAKWTLYFQFT